MNFTCNLSSPYYVEWSTVALDTIARDDNLFNFYSFYSAARSGWTPAGTQLYPTVPNLYPAVPNFAGWNQVDCYSVLGFRLNDASFTTGQGRTLLLLMTQGIPWELNLTHCEVNYITESVLSDYSSCLSLIEHNQ